MIFVVEPRNGQRTRWTFRENRQSRAFRRGLGDDAPTPAPQAAATVRSLLKQARDAALGGRPTDAATLFAQAQAIANATDQPSYFSDDLQYTQQVLAGDTTPAPSAPEIDRGGPVASAQGQSRRDAIGQQNARPNAVLAAGVSGFGQGLQDELSAAKKKLADVASTDWKKLAIYSAAIGAGLVALNVALNAFFSGFGQSVGKR